jgi:hypothetical protein
MLCGITNLPMINIGKVASDYRVHTSDTRDGAAATIRHYALSD